MTKPTNENVLNKTSRISMEAYREMCERAIQAQIEKNNPQEERSSVTQPSKK